MSFQRILIAVDSEPIAVHAADLGLELAGLLGAQVAFIHVVDPQLNFAPESGIPADELIARAAEDGKRLLAGFRERIKAQLQCFEFLEVAKPASAIVDAAKRWPADVIVIGSHGRGGLPRAVLGSVADAVIRHAPCPVLVVKAKE